MTRGGTAPYEYEWNNGAPDTEDPQGLVAGDYRLTITDANGCTQVFGPVTIDEPTELLATAVVESDADCVGNESGEASVTASGGTTPYSYFWSNGQTTATATGLSAGGYTVTVTDANGCEAVAAVTISDPNGLSLVVTGRVDVSCFGGSDGEATVLATGGAGGYSFSWSGGTVANINANPNTATDLSAGTYLVTVEDANGCEAVVSVEIEEPTLLIAEIVSSADVSCAGGADGSATVNATGGTTPYSYEWSNSQTGATATGLSAILYDVTVTDANGCEAVTSVLIGEPLSVPRWV
jgi:hypothetical protein